MTTGKAKGSDYAAKELLARALPIIQSEYDVLASIYHMEGGSKPNVVQDQMYKQMVEAWALINEIKKILHPDLPTIEQLHKRAKRVA